MPPFCLFRLFHIWSIFIRTFFFTTVEFLKLLLSFNLFALFFKFFFLLCFTKRKNVFLNNPNTPCGCLLQSWEKWEIDQKQLKDLWEVFKSFQKVNKKIDRSWSWYLLLLGYLSEYELTVHITYAINIIIRTWF